MGLGGLGFVDLQLPKTERGDADGDFDVARPTHRAPEPPYKVLDVLIGAQRRVLHEDGHHRRGGVHHAFQFCNGPVVFFVALAVNEIFFGNGVDLQGITFVVHATARDTILTKLGLADILRFESSKHLDILKHHRHVGLKDVSDIEHGRLPRHLVDMVGWVEVDQGPGIAFGAVAVTEEKREGLGMSVVGEDGLDSMIRSVLDHKLKIFAVHELSPVGSTTMRTTRHRRGLPQQFDASSQSPA